MKRFLISLIFFPCIIHAQLQLARSFSDNMVLQMDQPIHFWGKGKPGETITIIFHDNSKKIKIESDSSWSVYFKKQKANNIPQQILFQSGDEKIQLKNILIGDIWICSGQSNMEWPMSKEMHWNEEKYSANQPLIRFMNPPPAGRYTYGVEFSDSIKRRLTTKDFYVWDGWKVCDSNTIQPMSAVAYYFAKSIVKSKGVPIGLINLSIGGAPIESFIRREVMQNDAQFAVKVKKGNWLLNESLPAWTRERAQQNVGKATDAIVDDLGPNHGYKPGFAYESGVKPMSSMPIKGIIWYQGESNSLEKERVDEYGKLMSLMIQDYRQQWKNPDMPFYCVQLSSIDTAHYQSHFWPQFRDEQRQLMNQIHHGGMAVCSDIGFKDNVHPTNKKDVGERLARWALKNDYGENIIPSGPLPLEAIYMEGKIVVSFQYDEGLKTSDEKPVRGFFTNGRSDAEALIEKNKIIIHVKEKPQFIYYGWKPYSDGNLVNRELLPASTFKIAVK